LYCTKETGQPHYRCTGPLRSLRTLRYTLTVPYGACVPYTAVRYTGRTVYSEQSSSHHPSDFILSRTRQRSHRINIVQTLNSDPGTILQTPSLNAVVTCVGQQYLVLMDRDGINTLLILYLSSEVKIPLVCSSQRPGWRPTDDVPVISIGDVTASRIFTATY
jgi:hypothetical protein